MKVGDTGILQNFQNAFVINVYIIYILGIFFISAATACNLDVAYVVCLNCLAVNCTHDPVLVAKNGTDRGFSDWNNSYCSLIPAWIVMKK